MNSPTDAEPARWRWIGIAAIVGLIAFGAFVRIGTAYRDPTFNRHTSRGYLRTDPAMLTYFTQRVIDSGGRVPSDFRADPRLEYPDTTDIAAIETPGQEFVVGWLYLLFGRPVPLHLFCIWVMSIFASITVVGVYGLTFELTRSRRWAIAAAALFVVMVANYRTVGFILIREDFLLPWLALHLWLLARAARVKSVVAWA